MADKPVYPAGHVAVVPVGELATNCYLLDDGQGSVVVVDPGADAAAIEDALDGRPVSLVLVTHGHFDHVGALDAIGALSAAGWIIGEEDAHDLAAGLAQAARDFGRRIQVASSPARTVADGDVVAVGDLRLRVIAAPGHTPGGVTYVDDEHGLAFTGDTLFAGSAGRTDLRGGDYAALLGSLATLAQLPPQTAVLPGHGPASTIGDELRTNPFVRRACGR